MFRGCFYWFELFEEGLLSNRIRWGGENSSSYCPVRTLQIKAARKMAATDILAIKRITMALIKTVDLLPYKSIFSAKVV